ncbi:MAG: hypothetical protein K0S09_24 [Sphingobacteriaceae bacterium]|nr:hypothetical protein [Sphingobacteriaceae bacterium]
MLSVGEILVLGEELIEEFLLAIRDELIAYMDTEDRNATGKSKRSLQVTNIGPTTGQLIGSDSIEFVFRGRGPGKMPPLYAIIEWCAARGLPRSMAWIVAKRIAQHGTKLHRQGRDVLKETLTEARLKQFTDKLTAVYMAQIKSDIENLLQAA